MLLALGVFCFASSGCVSGILAKMAVQAPNQQNVPRVVREPEYAARFDAVYSQAWRLSVGPPAAELAVAVIEPGNYQLSHTIEERMMKNGKKRFFPRTHWVVPDGSVPTRVVPKGTILVLHGYMDTKENVIHWALFLAEAGYRTVLVDLRGHGRSSGDWIGYGAFETHDLSHLLDDLEKKGLLAGKAGVIGVSYGASVGLQLAAADSRIGTVVALEPFSSAEKAVVEFAHGVAPAEAAKISDSTFAAAVARAPKLAKFSWVDTDVLAAVKRCTVPLLFYHGANDTWISPQHSRLLSEHAPPGSELGILEQDDHLLLSMRLEPIAADVAAWFGEHLTAPVATTAAGR